MNRKKYIIIGVILMILIGTSLFFINSKDISAKATVASEVDLGIPTELIKVYKGDIIKDLNYVGTITPKKSVTVSPSLPGQIMKTYVEEGNIVKIGDPLFKLDDSGLSASLNTASKKVETLKTKESYLNGKLENFRTSSPFVKKLENLNSNYEYIKGESEKLEKLYQADAIAKTDYDKLIQEVDSTRLQIEELESTMNYEYDNLAHERNITQKQLEEANASINEINIQAGNTLIKSPIAGIVKKIHQEEGNFAPMGQALVNIDDNSQFIVKINVSESDIDKIDVGDKVILKSKALDTNITTEISKIIPNVNPKTRIGEIEIGPIKANKEMKLLAGNSIDVSIIIDQIKDKIIIPKSAIKILGDQSLVYKYEDGIVKEIKIKTGLTVGDNVEVTDGLEIGDKISVKNLSKLHDGSKVYVIEGIEEQ